MQTISQLSLPANLGGVFKTLTLMFGNTKSKIAVGAATPRLAASPGGLPQGVEHGGLGEPTSCYSIIIGLKVSEAYGVGCPKGKKMAAGHMTDSGVAHPQGLEGSGMAGQGETLGSPWPPLASCHTPMSVVDLVETHGTQRPGLDGDVEGEEGDAFEGYAMPRSGRPC
jgi:hypothetical protein